MNTQEYFKRITSVFRPEILQRMVVMIVGLGSGGSQVAKELGRLGVILYLVERLGETIQEHNIVRHVLGYASLGKLKLAEMVAFLKNLNPSVEVNTAEIDVVAEKERFATFVAQVRPHLILPCVDNEQAKHAINEIAVSVGVPTVGAGVYDGGIGGEIYVTRSRQACYACIAHELKLEGQTPNKPSNIDYNSLDLEEVRSTCALNIDITQIALIQTRIALGLLTEREVDISGIPREVNLCVFANRPIPRAIDRPLHCNFHVIPRNPDCLVCGDSPENAEVEASEILDSLSR